MRSGASNQGRAYHRQAQMALYEKVSAKIDSMYLKYISTCNIRVYSINEVCIEVTHYMCLSRHPKLRI